MKLRGGNLKEVEVEYKLLSEYPFFGDETVSYTHLTLPTT